MVRGCANGACGSLRWRTLALRLVGHTVDEDLDVADDRLEEGRCDAVLDVVGRVTGLQLGHVGTRLDEDQRVADLHFADAHAVALDLLHTYNANTPQ